MASATATVILSRAQDQFNATYLGHTSQGGHQILLTSMNRPAVRIAIKAGSANSTRSSKCGMKVPGTNGTIDCTAAYVHDNLLKQHRKVFHDFRPFECFSCEKLFSDPTDGIRHVCQSTRVSEGKKYICQVAGCVRKPTRSDNMNRHDKKKHEGLRTFKEFDPTTGNGAQGAASTINTVNSTKRRRNDSDDDSTPSSKTKSRRTSSSVTNNVTTPPMQAVLHPQLAATYYAPAPSMPMMRQNHGNDLGGYAYADGRPYVGNLARDYGHTQFAPPARQYMISDEPTSSAGYSTAPTAAGHSANFSSDTSNEVRGYSSLTKSTILATDDQDPFGPNRPYDLGDFDEFVDCSQCA